ncbi:MAG: PASTA domain-containing protein, partial [Candidatus Eremiobacteraeota bacterium]|nr:PASTA domain-containing protein [Candidatus Eremiobacteraeota bacterium]
QPPRPSRNPDRAYTYTSIAEDEERPSRSGGRTVALLAAALALAVVVGYILFGHPFSPLRAETVALSDYRNMTDRQAIQALTNAGLSYKVKYASSDSIAANHVISQSPGANAEVPKKNGIVELIVSNGQPTVGLPDFRTYTVTDATKDLMAQKFRVKVERIFNSAPKDSVVLQSPAASSKVRPGSLVVLSVSDGPKPISIPTLVGKKLSEANAIAAREGFVLNVTERAPFANIPADTIASQDPSGGVVVPHSDKAVVNVTVSSGAGSAAVPNAVSSDVATAQRTIAQAGFQSKLEYAIHPGSADNGTVIDQTPQPNAMTPKNSVILLVLSVPGEVPDTQGLSVDDARVRLRAAGYDVGNVTYTSEGAEGKVVRTEPEAGTQKRPGEVVNLIVNSIGKQ